MRKLFLVTVIMAVTAQAGMAQFQKGTKFLGANLGGFGFNSNKGVVDAPGAIKGYTDKNKSITVSLGPSVGIFVSEKMAVGGSLAFSFSHNKFTRRGEGNSFDSRVTNYNSTGINLGTYMRYYLANTSSILPFFQVTVGAGTGSGKSTESGRGSDAGGNYTYTGSTKSASQFNFNAGASFGITKMLNKNVGLDVALGYGFSRNTSTETSNYTFTYAVPPNITTTGESDFTGTNSGVSLSIGFQIFLDAKK
jgi:Outer membrane protein beta-barrel domain